MNRRNGNRLTKWLPLILAAAIGLGIFLGEYLSNRADLRTNLVISSGKINAILNIISRNYVDPVDVEDLIESTIPTIFEKLDPHSIYLSAEQNKKDEHLEGAFNGIGITFNMLSDTITVINVTPGGPSEKVGITAGDRILKIDTIDYLKNKINNDEIKKLLRGEQDSQVKLLVRPYNQQDTIKEVTITRGIVPVKTINAAYPLTPEIGYIKINSFGRPTYNEFLIAIAKLKSKGCTSLIIDLRGNGGGYMDAAINMINEFLSENEMIVYAEGQFFPKRISEANGKGTCKDTPIIVLTDEFSGSSSEIFAGAIQDNDRGLIVGRRTYGKGLVQAPFELIDGSRVTLTIARYYTPSGRSIQKEYKLGHNEEYERDLYNRFMNGEFYNQDSIHIADSVKFFTKNNRVVYGGGGIMPDVFVPRDTTGYTSYLSSIINDGILHRYAFEYADKNRNKLSELGDYEAIHSYLKKQPLLWDFVDFAAKKGIRKRMNLIYISAQTIQESLYANIIYYISGEEGSVAIANDYDSVIKKAIELFDSGEALPNHIKDHHFAYEEEKPKVQQKSKTTQKEETSTVIEENETENQSQQEKNSEEEELESEKN